MRFLCFHGRGTNAKVRDLICAGTAKLPDVVFIFLQPDAAKFRYALGQRHEFVFVDAPFVADPAPGTGIEAGTARRWSCDNLTDYRRMHSELVHLISTCGPFGGVMGFSEGGAVAAGALIVNSRLHFADFKCGIFFSAATPQDFEAQDGPRDLDPVTDGIPINVPTAHIWSEEGLIYPGMGRGLISLCKEDVRSEFVHKLGHDVPGARGDGGFLGALLAVERTIERAQG